MKIETVKVVADVTEQNQHGYVVINKADLTDVHELFTPEQTKKKVKAKEPEAPAEGK